MDDWTSGFRIDAAFHPWGTLFDVAVPGRVDQGYASVASSCRSAYGFATVYAEPAAPRPDRPVTTVAYELANTGTAPRYLFAELVARLGPPDDISRDVRPERANEGSVVLYATWNRGKVQIGLSLYGAPRPSDFGDGLGKLYLSWVEPNVAAAPFLATWTAVNQATADAAAGAQVKVFSLKDAVYEGAVEPLSPAALALSTPDLLLTPPAVAARLAPTTFALWSDAPRRVGICRPCARPCCWAASRPRSCNFSTSPRRAAAAMPSSASGTGRSVTSTDRRRSSRPSRPWRRCPA